MNLSRILLFLGLFLLVGCFPLREIKLVKGPAHPDILLYKNCLLAGLDLNRVKIDKDHSYIDSPEGVRYHLEIKPHQFDIDQHRDYVSALVYPRAPDNSPLKKWHNGIWSYHFVVETNGVTRIIDQQWKYYFFFYSPLIHGVPN